MYLVSPEHHRYQLIRSRFSPDQATIIYQLNNVMQCFDFAIHTLQELYEQYRKIYTLAAQTIKSNLYVDDFVCGASSVTEALHLQRQLLQLLHLGCFELHKWSSNSCEILGSVLLKLHQNPESSSRLVG